MTRLQLDPNLDYYYYYHYYYYYYYVPSRTNLHPGASRNDDVRASIENKHVLHI